MKAAHPAGSCTMRDGRLISTEVIVPRPKRFVRESLEMPDGYRLDWYYIDAPASVMVVPITAAGDLVMIRQYRHNLRAYALELPAGMINEGEAPETAAVRELEEETGFELDGRSQLQALGTYYSLPSETNKYTYVFLARPVVSAGTPVLDTEIEKYFDMSVVEMPLGQAFDSIGTVICGMETVGALMLARSELADRAR
jgi:8-oxo-dGTP pyrophosphatase MutT (NUDIX family)